jgi:hypothetical protein
VESWQRCELTEVTAKVVIYEAFVEGKLEPISSLSNTFTSAFKELEPIPQLKRRRS